MKSFHLLFGIFSSVRPGLLQISKIILVTTVQYCNGPFTLSGSRSGVAWKGSIDLYLYHSHQAMPLELLLKMPLENGYVTHLQAATLSLGTNRPERVNGTVLIYKIYRIKYCFKKYAHSEYYTTSLTI